jgi:hypothetical protein
MEDGQTGNYPPSVLDRLSLPRLRGSEWESSFLNYQFGWLRGPENSLKYKTFVVAGAGFEPTRALPPQSNSLGLFSPRFFHLDA